jgi:hypothetical protein
LTRLLRISREAKAEMAAASRWYDRERAGLGVHFLNMVAISNHRLLYASPSRPLRDRRTALRPMAPFVAQPLWTAPRLIAPQPPSPAVSPPASRAAFILGQNPFSTGLLKVGLPAAKQGVQDKDPTIAQLLKPLGYATGQIGKNHLGDRNEFLPTVHGFDEFYGILYDLNAMQEPYNPQYPKDPEFRARFSPRNIIESKASDKDDPTVDPRWGRVGKQIIKDGGPLPPHPGMDPKAKVSMEDVEVELVKRSNDFMERSVKAGKPFFL